MNPLTPYSFSFAFFRIVALWILLMGLYEFATFFLPNSGPAHEIGNAYLIGISIREFLPGALLYFLSPWLASAVIWRIKE